jgi:hypothetical protein
LIKGYYVVLFYHNEKTNQHSLLNKSRANQKNMQERKSIKVKSYLFVGLWRARCPERVFIFWRRFVKKQPEVGLVYTYIYSNLVGILLFAEQSVATGASRFVRIKVIDCTGSRGFGEERGGKV